MKSLWLLIVQYHILQAQPRLHLPLRGGLRLSFIINNDPPGNHHTFHFPYTLCVAPIPTPLGAKFCHDLANAGVDLNLLPQYPQDMEILLLPYPIRFPLEWWELAKHILRRTTKESTK